MSAIEDLLEVMRELRDPDHGCPWDLRQTSATIAPHTLDETHEVLDAIERGDMDNLREELGDLLFNIVFHARLAEEQGHFDFDDVARGIADKMRRRHPHVFGELRDARFSEAELSQQWQALKAAEKSPPEAPTAEAPTTLAPDSANSAMYRARQLQQDAAHYGFDWPSIEPVFDKLEEEVDELRHAFAAGEKSAIASELGDVLFVCINLARHAGVNAEMALRETNRKFVRRFEYMHEQMAAAGIEMDQRELEQMEMFWQESKGIVG